MSMNPPRWRAMLYAALAALSLPAPAADAKIVFDWQATAQEVLKPAQGLRRSRAGLLADLAVFNALNAIEPRYRSYGPELQAQPDASPEAAVAAATWGVLSAEPLLDHTRLARSYNEAIAKLPEGPARNAGVSLGLRAAATLLALRAGDSFDRVEAPALAAAPGVHQPIPGRKMPNRLPKEPLRPFAVASIEPFDPGPPPAHDSPEARRAMTEAKSIGARDSATRSADQTAAALFWNSGEDSDMDELVKGLITERGWSALETARFAALASLSAFDSRIMGMEFKRRYAAWRPMTAIRSPFAPEALRDPAWEPLALPPTDPDYPSGGATGAGLFDVWFAVLQPRSIKYFNSTTGQTRQFATADAMATELANARVWAGIHTRYAIDAGRRMGRRLAEEVFATQLPALPAPAGR